MMPILQAPGLMMPGQFGPINRVLVCEFKACLTCETRRQTATTGTIKCGKRGYTYSNHVLLGDTLRDANHQRDFRIDRLKQSSSSQRGWYEHHGGICTRLHSLPIPRNTNGKGVKTRANKEWANFPPREPWQRWAGSNAFAQPSWGLCHQQTWYHTRCTAQSGMYPAQHGKTTSTRTPTQLDPTTEARFSSTSKRVERMKTQPIRYTCTDYYRTVTNITNDGGGLRENTRCRWRPRLNFDAFCPYLFACEALADHLGVVIHPNLGGCGQRASGSGGNARNGQGTSGQHVQKVPKDWLVCMAPKPLLLAASTVFTVLGVTRVLFPSYVSMFAFRFAR
jgi:hypothetical protein